MFVVKIPESRRCETPYFNATNTTGKFSCSLARGHRGPHRAYSYHDLSMRIIDLQGGLWGDQFDLLEVVVHECWEELWLVS